MAFSWRIKLFPITLPDIQFELIEIPFTRIKQNILDKRLGKLYIDYHVSILVWRLTWFALRDAYYIEPLFYVLVYFVERTLKRLYEPLIVR